LSHVPKCLSSVIETNQAGVEVEVNWACSEWKYNQKQ